MMCLNGCRNYTIREDVSIKTAYNNWAATYDLDRNLTRDLDRVVTRKILAHRRCRSTLELVAAPRRTPFCSQKSVREFSPSGGVVPIQKLIKEVDAMLRGGCFCGWIRYETGATPFDETNCHCSICRRTTGAPFVAWFSMPRSEFRLVCGEPTRFESTAKGTRSFCPRCGTQL